MGYLFSGESISPCQREFDVPLLLYYIYSSKVRRCDQSQRTVLGKKKMWFVEGTLQCSIFDLTLRNLRRYFEQNFTSHRPKVLNHDNIFT